MAVAVPFISLGVMGNTICNRSLSPESLCKLHKVSPQRALERRVAFSCPHRRKMRTAETIRTTPSSLQG